MNRQNMPDLSGASSAELTAAPVLLNGAPVLFDFKVPLMPVQLEAVETRGGAGGEARSKGHGEPTS